MNKGKGFKLKNSAFNNKTNQSKFRDKDYRKNQFGVVEITRKWNKIKSGKAMTASRPPPKSAGK